VWIEDPDGNSWEVFVVKADAPVMRDEASTCCAPMGSEKAEVKAAGCCAPGGVSQKKAGTPSGCCG
jgi:hypothetical protein